MNPKYFAVVAGVALVCAAAGGWYFFSRAPAVTNYPSAGTDIVAFGDSLVVGQGSSAGGDFVSKLSRHIGEPIINLGVSGNTTEKALQRINDLDAYKPKVVLVLLGGNDYLRRVPSYQTFTNLEKIIEDIQARGAIVVLLGIRGGILNDRYDKEFARLAELHGTAYVPDVLDGLLGRDEYMSDAIHPSDAGYAIIAQRVAATLEPLLK